MAIGSKQFKIFCFRTRALAPSLTGGKLIRPGSTPPKRITFPQKDRSPVLRLNYDEQRL